MKRLITLAALVFTAAALWTAPSTGHGAGYPPPPPPTQPPPNPTAPPAPPPIEGGGGAPGGGWAGPSTPGPAAPRAPQGGGGPATPGPQGPTAPKGAPTQPTSPRVGMPDLSGWSWWWIYNRDPYLNLKEKVMTGGPATGSDDFFLGQNTKPVLASAAPSDDDFRALVGPALQRAIDAEFSDRVLCDAMIALAKLHPIYVPDGGLPMREMFTQHLDHPNQKVVESAVAALGMMADPACVGMLCDIAEDNEAGRLLLKRDSVPGRTRPLAALAVGLIGAHCEREDVRRYIVHRLVAILNSGRQPSPDLYVGCITSIGLTPLSPLRRPVEREKDILPSASREGQVQFLADLLLDTDRHEYVRAHVPKALGLLVEGRDGPAKQAAAEALLDVLENRKKDRRLVRHGVVEGLGLVGDADADKLDVKIRKALRKSVKEGDAFQRQLSLISVALASSRPGSGAGEPLSALEDERDYLIEQLVKGKSRTKPWAALALGLQAFHCREAGQENPPEVTLVLLKTMEDVGSPEDVGAWCVALGLLGDPQGAPALHDRLDRINDDLALGGVAVSLGLLDDREAIPLLEKIVADATFRPNLLREGAIGLALLGNKRVIDELLEVLATRDSMAIKSAAVTAIGFVADKRAIPPLVKLLEDEEQMDLTRSYSAIAAGVICERDLLPWPALYSNHFNYSAATESLITDQGTGILNLR